MCVCVCECKENNRNIIVDKIFTSSICWREHSAFEKITSKI